MRRAPSAHEIELATDRRTHAITVCLDLSESGLVRGVIGRQDLTTRRYVFDRVEPFKTEQRGLQALIAALPSVGQAYWEEKFSARW